MRSIVVCSLTLFVSCKSPEARPTPIAESAAPSASNAPSASAFRSSGDLVLPADAEVTPGTASTLIFAAPPDARPEREVKGPIGVVTIEPGASTAPMVDLDRVLASTRPKLRSCYQRGLYDDPNMQGTGKLELSVAPSGDVISASLRADSLAPNVRACIEYGAKRVTFAPPDGGKGATVTVGLRFVLQT